MLIQIPCNLFSSAVVLFIKGIRAYSIFVNVKQITMKTISRLRYFLYLSILIVGCTTGKNALQKGNYDQSVFKSVDRLKSSPKNAEALYVLPVAYESLQPYWLAPITSRRQIAHLHWQLRDRSSVYCHVLQHLKHGLM